MKQYQSILFMGLIVYMICNPMGKNIASEPLRVFSSDLEAFEFLPANKLSGWKIDKLKVLHLENDTISVAFSSDGEKLATS